MASWRAPAIVVALVAAAMGTAALLWRGGAPDACPGSAFVMRTAAGGSAPYVPLTADGRRGNFLLDWGSTSSSLSDTAFPASTTAGRALSFDLPSFTSGQFASRHYPAGAGPADGQVGLVGTDFLAQMSAMLTYEPRGGSVRLSAKPCDGARLVADGFVPVRQDGHFSADPRRVSGKPNIPVLFVRLGAVTVPAQIDSGYEDALWQHAIDINEALYRRLVDGGVRLTAVGSTRVATCAGSEMRQILRAEAPVLIVSESGRAIRQIPDYNLFRKMPNSCGGIAAMDTPAAQLGASFLRTLGTIVIDGKSETVWVKPAPN